MSRPGDSTEGFSSHNSLCKSRCNSYKSDLVTNGTNCSSTVIRNSKETKPLKRRVVSWSPYPNGGRDVSQKAPTTTVLHRRTKLSTLITGTNIGDRLTNILVLHSSQNTREDRGGRSLRPTFPLERFTSTRNDCRRGQKRGSDENYLRPKSVGLGTCIP